MDTVNNEIILKIPNHIAIIPDGNRRWAKNNGLPSLEGHRRGFETANADIEKAKELGVHTMTLWGFSTENWNRSPEEVTYLMKLFEDNIENNLKKAHKNETRIVHLGRKDRIPNSLKLKIEKAETETLQYQKHVLNMAIDYGGQDELLRAINKAMNSLQEGKITFQDLAKEQGKYNDKYPYYQFKEYLDTAGQPYPYPDLVIRTSGEQRLSGFMPWQICYSEYYFTKLHMPDFGPEQLMEALKEFSQRERRFGGNSPKETLVNQLVAK